MLLDRHVAPTALRLPAQPTSVAAASPGTPPGDPVGGTIGGWHPGTGATGRRRHQEARISALREVGRVDLMAGEASRVYRFQGVFCCCGLVSTFSPLILRVQSGKNLVAAEGFPRKSCSTIP